MVGGQHVFSVDGQRIVVVGGTAGIGLGVAAYLVEAGATVVITGRRDGADIAADVGATFVRMDVADRDSVAAGFAQSICLSLAWAFNTAAAASDL